MDLSRLNPWWNTLGLWQDPDLSRVKKSLIQYHPTPILASECEMPGVITVRGPRRAGKTVALKLLVASLIEDHGWDARTICWTTLEPFRTLAQVEEHLRQLPKNIKALFIDEATAVIGWQRVIKMLVDDGTLSSLFIAVTGSSAYDLKKGAERMAGRRGQHSRPDRTLLPMGFNEFHRQWLRHHPDIDSETAFTAYLKIGGFPFRVEQALLGKTELREAGSVFEDIVFYEVTRRKLDRSIALEVIGRLGAVGCNACSYEGFAKPLSITRETVRRYLDMLGDSFLLTSFSTYDTSRGRVAPKKDRKFLWTDPALALLPYWLHQSTSPELPALAELVVGTELLRRYEVRLFEGTSAPRNVFTWKSTSGKEIDFLVIDKSRGLTLPVEVKYQNTISDWDFQVLEKAFGQGYLLTANTAYPRPKSVGMPVYQFLAQAEPRSE